MVDFVGLEFLKTVGFPWWSLWFYPGALRVSLSWQGSECSQVKEVAVAVLCFQETDALAVASEGERRWWNAHRTQILASKQYTENA